MKRPALAATLLVMLLSVASRPAAAYAAGHIVFGRSLSHYTVKGRTNTFSLRAGGPMAYVATFAGKAGSWSVRLVLTRSVPGGGHAIVDSVSVHLSSPETHMVASSFPVSALYDGVGNPVGTYHISIWRGSTLLASGQIRVTP
jgi:hypothetical protein